MFPQRFGLFQKIALSRVALFSYYIQISYLLNTTWNSQKNIYNSVSEYNMYKLSLVLGTSFFYQMPNWTSDQRFYNMYKVFEMYNSLDFSEQSNL